MSYIHSNPTRENEPNALPNVEVFQATSGWYWIVRIPSDGMRAVQGPFDSEAEAILDAQSDALEDEYAMEPDDEDKAMSIRNNGGDK